MNNNEDIKKIKMEKEMMDMRAEREFLRKECIRLNKKFKEKQKKSEIIRDKNDEMLHDKNFVEHEIKIAHANQLKLLKKLDSVKAEFERLKREEVREMDTSHLLDLKVSQGMMDKAGNDKSLEYTKMLIDTTDNDHSLINKHTGSQPILHTIDSVNQLEITNEPSEGMKQITFNTGIKKIGKKGSRKQMTGRRSTQKLKQKSNYRLVDAHGKQIDPFQPYPKGAKIVNDIKTHKYLNQV